MRRSALTFAIAAVLSAASAVAQTPTSDQNNGSTYQNSNDRNKTTQSNPDKSNTNKDTHGNTEQSRGDEKFLKEFAQANAAEVAAGKLAEQQAQSADVKAFGKHMVEDHSKAIKKVETIATNLNVDVKAKPDMMHKAKSAMLDGKRGADFDKAYVEAQVKDHQKVADMLEKQIREGHDASAKKLASDALPEVKHHLELATQLQAKLANNGDSSRDSHNPKDSTGTKPNTGANNSSGSNSTDRDANNK